MVLVKRPLALMLLASAPFGLSQTAMAQDAYDEEDGWFEWSDDEIDSGDYEYEADEGWHEDEWYDPSDWFDDDYEYDSGDNPTDYYEWTDGSDPSWYGYSGYYDGYVDGYYDEDYGYDYWQRGWGHPYRSSYTSGYYDGYYDSIKGYDYDPTYYYLPDDTQNQSSASDRQRRDDETRDRGDRARSGSSESRQDRSEMNRDRKRQGADKQIVRRRGTVESLSSASLRNVPDDHHLMRVRLENGESVVADFGPRMSRDRLPFSEGDRVTICGERMASGSQGYLKVHKIRSGDETVRLRPGPYHDGTEMSGSKRENRQNRGGDDARRSGESWNGRATVTGRIDDVWRAARDVSGHALYRVRMTDGKTVLVAVESENARELRMREGDRIRIEGERKRLGGREVIDVRRIRGQSASGRSD